jgi:iron uptake system component EfeO
MRVTIATTVVAVFLAVELSACSSERTTASSPTTTNLIAVAADELHCAVTRDTAATGEVTFRVSNSGQVVSEFYVYAAGDRVLGEVEDIAPGQSRQLIVAMSEPGSYTVSCRPGMTGEGIQHPFTVTGAHGGGDHAVTPQ